MMSCTPRVAHHQLQMGVVGLVLPADPLVPAGQPARGGVEQQAAEQALAAVAQEVGHVAAERLAVAQRVVALDPLLPRGESRPVRDGVQPQRSQAGEIGGEIGGWGAVRSVSATARSGPRGRGRLAGSETMPCSASCSSKRVARRTRLAPEPACQCKCSQTVRASSVRLSPEQACTISCTSAICRRVRRLPKNVVEGRS